MKDFNGRPVAPECDLDCAAHAGGEKYCHGSCVKASIDAVVSEGVSEGVSAEEKAAVLAQPTAVPDAAKRVTWNDLGRNYDVDQDALDRAGMEQMSGITALMRGAGDSKPTNPKDAVGIRKAPLSTVPMNVVAEVGLAMMEGALKYGRHNYRGVGVRASVYFDAAMRHMIAWWEGEDIDPDSGISHITKTIACLTVLRDAQSRDMVTDDRPPHSMQFYQGLNKIADGLADKHADKSPKHWTNADALHTK
jgi:hypothetical protein